MKKVIALTSLLSLLACSSASAIGISIDPLGLSPEGIYTLWLDGMNEEFDSIDLTVVGEGVELLNPDSGLNGFVPRGPGDPFTYINVMLSAPTTFPGGQGWSLVANEATPAGIRVAGGPLGAKIDTTAPLFLANVMVPLRGTFCARMTVVNDGQTIAEVQASNSFACIPEPTTLSLTGLTLLGFVCAGRR